MVRMMQIRSNGTPYKAWFPTTEREKALDAITQRIFDCHWDQLDKDWTRQAIIRRYDQGERQ